MQRPPSSAFSALRISGNPTTVPSRPLGLPCLPNLQSRHASALHCHPNTSLRYLKKNLRTATYIPGLLRQTINNISTIAKQIDGHLGHTRYASDKKSAAWGPTTKRPFTQFPSTLVTHRLDRVQYSIPRCHTRHRFFLPRHVHTGDPIRIDLKGRKHRLADKPQIA